MKLDDLKKFNLSELNQIGSSLAVLITGDMADSSYEEIFNSLDARVLSLSLLNFLYGCFV